MRIEPEPGGGIKDKKIKCDMVHVYFFVAFFFTHNMPHKQKRETHSDVSCGLGGAVDGCREWGLVGGWMHNIVIFITMTVI